MDRSSLPDSTVTGNAHARYFDRNTFWTDLSHLPPIMKVLHVLDHSLPITTGYTFRSREIILHQRAMGWQTIHLTSPRQNASDMPVESAGGLDFFRTPKPRPRWGSIPGLWPLAEMLATRKRLDEVVQSERPDIIHAHSPALDAWPAIGAGKRFGIPVVYEVRGFWEDAAVDHGTTVEGGLRYRVSRLIETLALRRADAVTAICHGLADEIAATRGVDAKTITLIPNAVDVSRFDFSPATKPEVKTRLGLGNGPVVGFLGSFYGYEGLSLLLRAFPAVSRALPDARLLLVGGGSEADALHKLARELNLGASVIFTGPVPNEQVEEMYDAIDVVAFPRAPMRLTELVTPLKPLEAMARGKPVVASDVGGHKELIEHDRTGVLFKAGDQQALEQALLRTLGDPDLRTHLQQQGRLFVERERTWQRSVQNYETAYQIARERAIRAGKRVSALS